MRTNKKQKLWRPKDVCPICLERDRIEREYLGFLTQKESNVQKENEEELKDFFTKGDGLCAPHYGRLLETSKYIPEWLIEFHNHKFTELFRRTDQFIELSAYGRQAEFAALSKKRSNSLERISGELTRWRRLVIACIHGNQFSI